MGGEADETHPPLSHQTLTHLQAPSWTQAVLQIFPGVQSVDGQQIHMVEVQVAHRLFELGQELLRIGAGANFCLHDQILPGKSGKMRPNCISEVP